MKVTGIRGKTSYIKFATDKGVFTGKGELLASGFCVYCNSLTDENGLPVKENTQKELIGAVDEYTEKYCPDFRVAFEHTNEKLIIKAADYIKTGFSVKDSEKLNQVITPLLDCSDKIVVDFDGITIFTASFFNNVFAKLIVEIGFKEYSRRILVVNLTELGDTTYRHSVNNAAKNI